MGYRRRTMALGLQVVQHIMIRKRSNKDLGDNFQYNSPPNESFLGLPRIQCCMVAVLLLQVQLKRKTALATDGQHILTA
eukprot:1645135-Amphidinium_carterae.2